MFALSCKRGISRAQSGWNARLGKRSCDLDISLLQCRSNLALRMLYPFVCLSVLPSVTLCDCIIMVQARITKFSPWDAPRTLVYRDKFVCLWVRGFPWTRVSKRGTP